MPSSGTRIRLLLASRTAAASALAVGAAGARRRATTPTADLNGIDGRAGRRSARPGQRRADRRGSCARPRPTTRRCSSSSSTGPVRVDADVDALVDAGRERHGARSPCGSGRRVPTRAVRARCSRSHASDRRGRAGRGHRAGASGRLRRHRGPVAREVETQVRDAQAANDRSTENVDAVVDGRLSAKDAERLDVVNAIQPTLGDFIVSLDGQTVHGRRRGASCSTPPT